MVALWNDESRENFEKGYKSEAVEKALAELDGNTKLEKLPATVTAAKEFEMSDDAYELEEKKASE